MATLSHQHQQRTAVVYTPELNSMGIIVCKEILCAEQEVEQTPCQEIVLSKYHPVGVAGLQPDEVDCDPDLPLQSGGVVTHVYLEDPDCVTVGNPTVCTRWSWSHMVLVNNTYKSFIVELHH